MQNKETKKCICCKVETQLDESGCCKACADDAERERVCNLSDNECNN